MLEPTKKRPTEIELRFKGPESKRNDAIKVLRDMGFVDLSNSGAPWRDACPALQENETGTYLHPSTSATGKQTAHRLGRVRATREMIIHYFLLQIKNT